MVVGNSAVCCHAVLHDELKDSNFAECVMVIGGLAACSHIATTPQNHRRNSYTLEGGMVLGAAFELLDCIVHNVTQSCMQTTAG